MTRNAKDRRSVAVFLAVVFILVPGADRGDRTDRSLLHADLGGAAQHRQRRRVAHLLYRPHQYRPGRLCADGRLCLGHPGRELRRVVLADAAARRTVLRRRERADRPADPAAARRLFRHGDAGADRSGAAAGAGAADHQWRQGHGQHPAARRAIDLRPHPRSGFRDAAKPPARLLLCWR